MRNNLSDSERSVVGALGGNKRVENAALLPKVTHKGHLVFGDVEIPCAVIEGKLRVLSSHGIEKAFFSGNPNTRKLEKTADIVVSGEHAQLPYFMAKKAIIPFIIKGLSDTSLLLPIKYKDSKKHEIGYRAELMPILCGAWVQALNSGTLQKQQEKAASRAEQILVAMAKVGIISLVDEVTGFQFFREKNDLQKLLSKYLAEERLEWAKMFPDIFYKHIYRLKGWEWGKTNKRTPLIGKITNQIVYEKLPDGVLEELRRVNPPVGLLKNRMHRHHQFLSTDVGQKDLTKHLVTLIALMKASDTWDEFMIFIGKVSGENGKIIDIY